MSDAYSTLNMRILYLHYSLVLDGNFSTMVGALVEYWVISYLAQFVSLSDKYNKHNGLRYMHMFPLLDPAAPLS